MVISPGEMWKRRRNGAGGSLSRRSTPKGARQAADWSSEQRDMRAREGRTAEVRAAFEKLIRDYPRTWFDRTAKARLAEMGRTALSATPGMR